MPKYDKYIFINFLFLFFHFKISSIHKDSYRNIKSIILKILLNLNILIFFATILFFSEAK